MQEEYRSIGSLIVSRAWLYELFRKVIGGQPTSEMIAFLSCPTTAAALEEYSASEEEACAILVAFANECAQFDCNDLESFQSAFNRVIVGLGKPGVFLWESSWETIDGSVFSAKTLAVRQAFKNQGMMARQMNHIPEDSLATMLEFCAKLAKLDYADYVAGNASALSSRLREESTFVASHILNWISKAVESAKLKYPEGNLYVSLLGAIEAFLQLDVAFANNAIEWLRFDAGIEPVGECPELTAFENVMAELRKLDDLQLPFLSDSEIVVA